MSLTRPRLRNLESFPVSEQNGEVLFALRDPEGYGRSVVIPHEAAVLASLMDGRRSLEEIREEFEKRFGEEVPLEDVEGLIQQLDSRYLLDSDHFRAYWKREVEGYLNAKLRPPAHAGGAYQSEAAALKKQLAELFTGQSGPGAPNFDRAKSVGSQQLCGVLSPHIDFYRGGPTFAWAYKRLVEESDADLFIVFGTAHKAMNNLFSITKKHFDTPIGAVETDHKFVSSLTAQLNKTPEGKELNLFGDELAHRFEHSLEFQMVMLQYLLGERRPFKVVPVLVGSFHRFIDKDKQPIDSPHVAAFVAAMRAAASQYQGKICYVGGVDLAHIGQRFGDRTLLSKSRLTEQAKSDQALLAEACRPDAAAFFESVAKVNDRNRICGLSPTYAMLEVMQPARGEVLKYAQAVEEDGTACVSFASAAFYR